MRRRFSLDKWLNEKAIRNDITTTSILILSDGSQVCLVLWVDEENNAEGRPFVTGPRVPYVINL